MDTLNQDSLLVLQNCEIDNHSDEVQESFIISKVLQLVTQVEDYVPICLLVAKSVGLPLDILLPESRSRS